MIPKPENSPSVAFQIVGAPIIRFGVCGMLAAIEFDDELLLCACEVGNKRPDGFLASELAAPQLSVAQMAPEASFCVGHVFAQNAGEMFHAAFHPSP